MKHLKNNIVFIFLFLSLQLYAQTEQDTVKTVQSSDSVFVMTKSPWGAVLRSAVLPGWGQIYNESYWKAPISWGFIVYFGSVWINQNNLYKEYQDKFTQSLIENPGTGNSRYKIYRDAYRNQRDEFAVYLGITYFLTLVDAYVDAHLFDFDVSVDLISTTPQVNFRIPLR